MSYGTVRLTSAIRVIAGVIMSAAFSAALLAAFLAAFLSASAAPASAHTALKASSPRDGGAIDAAPSRLQLEFTAPILNLGYRVVVQGPDGAQYQTAAPPQVAGTKLTLPLKPLGPAGAYRVTFRVVAYDGHPLAGGMRFTLTKPGPAAGGSAAVARQIPLAPVPQTPGSVYNAPRWAPWVGGTVALILMSGALLFGRRVTRGLDQ